MLVPSVNCADSSSLMPLFVIPYPAITHGQGRRYEPIACLHGAEVEKLAGLVSLCAPMIYNSGLQRVRYAKELDIIKSLSGVRWGIKNS